MNENLKLLVEECELNQLDAYQSELLVIFLKKGSSLVWPDKISKLVNNACQAKVFEAKNKASLLLWNENFTSNNILLIGLSDLKLDSLLKAFTNALASCKNLANANFKKIAFALHEVVDVQKDFYINLTCELLNGFYHFKGYKTKKNSALCENANENEKSETCASQEEDQANDLTNLEKIEKLVFLSPAAHLKEVDFFSQIGFKISKAINLSKEIANRPANFCTPDLLAKEAQKMCRGKNLEYEVLDEKEIAALGMGSFLCVAQGSIEPPRFIIIKYNESQDKNAPPFVLIGKGITFDSGGISLKPGKDMDYMKYDMSGAACVISTMHAIADLGLKINVIALVPTCENMPSDRAVKPSDVVTSLSGKTIEVINTDAEGRLILCDAITYAKRYNPELIVDVGTLTGACLYALGNFRAGMFSNDDKYANSMVQAADASKDLIWRMPLDKEYGDLLESHCADIVNCVYDYPGTITAAKFLEFFVEKTPWVHLDIAGVAYKSGKAKGSTGRVVPLLTRFLMQQDPDLNKHLSANVLDTKPE